MKNVAIIGASGFTGLELMRILATHDSVELVAVTSRKHAGKNVTELFPEFKGFYDELVFTDTSECAGIDAELFFSALPHGASMEIVPKLLEKGAKVVDLSADFRLKDASVYEEWYKKHEAPIFLNDAVYGIPEFNREEIKSANLVANPGCYPTSVLLALAPLLQGDAIIEAENIIIDSKSGVSGAGAEPSKETSFVQVSEGFRAYKLFSHRHTPEIEQGLSALAGASVEVTFTPHLLPVSRGILSTIYASLEEKSTTLELLEKLSDFYKDESFVRVLPEGDIPDISRVRGSNLCDIGLQADPDTGRVIIVSAIDNLMKGASGQAVQNMNIMLGIKEETGLLSPPLFI
jgi:N-acetyl-gamma-glutamyl-phosphate reductase